MRLPRLWDRLTTRILRVAIAAFAVAPLIFCQHVFARDSDSNSDSNRATITATVSKHEVQVAEPFWLTVEVSAPTGSVVAFPTIADRMGDFEIFDSREFLDIPAEAATSNRIWKRELMLESIVTGDRTIPAMEVHVAFNEQQQTIHSDPIPVRILSVLEGRADPTAMRDIQSVVDVEVATPRNTTSAYWIAGGIGVLTLGIATIAMIVRRRRNLTPVQWALDEIGHVEQSSTLQNGDRETLLGQLSSILREYLELQFDVSAPMQTTQEFLEQIESRQGLDSELANRCGQIFAKADQAKFAGWQLTAAELGQAIDTSRDLIQQTGRSIASMMNSNKKTNGDPSSQT